MNNFSEKALTLILATEGLNQPGNWPGGSSGVTIGIGYDLGYVTMDQFESDWGGSLSPNDLEQLKTAVGLIGIKAKNRALQFVAIRIKRAPAEKVFLEKTIPLYQFKAKQAFPGIENLPLDAQGAIVSLVFNRGTSMIGERRTEMLAIRKAVSKGDLREIAKQIRSMKRLWIGKGLDGLLRRRDAEADLVESSL
jgi:GH24 family phage-related lysozyme (muramidase)